MWIVIRLVIAAVVFGLRIFRPVSRPVPTEEFAGTPYVERLSWSKDKEITHFQIGVPLPLPIIFRLEEEKASDRFFKRLGLAKGLQTGDDSFDSKVYVACDHPALHQLLIASERARAFILQALEFGFRRISGDGKMLWLEKSAGRGPDDDELETLVGLGAAMADLGSRPGNVSDPFAARVAIGEALVWAIFAYGVSALVMLFYQARWEYFDIQRLYGLGLLATIVLFLLLLASIAIFLKGSSRGHRILTERAFVLAIGLLLTGTQTVSDLNQNVGTPEQLVVTREIARTLRAEHQKKDRESTYTYYLVFKPTLESPEIVLPAELQVREGLFSRAAPGRIAEIHLAKGWLGIPWYEKIDIR